VGSEKKFFFFNFFSNFFSGIAEFETEFKVGLEAAKAVSNFVEKKKFI